MMLYLAHFFPDEPWVLAQSERALRTLDSMWIDPPGYFSRGPWLPEVKFACTNYGVSLGLFRLPQSGPSGWRPGAIAGQAATNRYTIAGQLVFIWNRIRIHETHSGLPDSQAALDEKRRQEEGACGVTRETKALTLCFVVLARC